MGSEHAAVVLSEGHDPSAVVDAVPFMPMLDEADADLPRVVRR
jgi:hypothetical protein